MSAPQLVTTYPNNLDVGIPVGESIILSFDRGIDTNTIRDFVVLYGRDFDQTSGAESQLWVDPDTGRNPYFLRSPGFTGLVDVVARIVYYDLDTDADIELIADNEIDEASYGVAGAGHRVYITPKIGQLAPDTQYTLQILGDPSSTGTTGVSSRTIYDMRADPGNTSTTGNTIVNGTYTGTTDDEMNVRITVAGDIGTAEYKYWFSSAGESSAVFDKLTNRRYRVLDRGVQVRFAGLGFEVGDLFTASLQAAERMATTTKIVFTTNDGTYTAAPDSPSTPAPSEPPESTIPPVPGASTVGETLQVIEMSPPDGSFNISNNTRTITVVFSEQLDASTVTPTSVRIFKYPVLGWWQGMPEPVELAKKLTVAGQVLTIEI